MELRPQEKSVENRRLPSWMRKQKQDSEQVLSLKRILREKNLHTVCQSAGCPNITECFQKPTATFMILGDVCTRQCKFCGVSEGKPTYVDPDEPRHIGETVHALGLKHVVITSVTRDDLSDGGAGQFAKTIHAIQQTHPEATIEALIPDFGGDKNSLKTVLDAPLHILNHNVETVPRLYKTIRPKADFSRSINILKNAKVLNPDIITKSGMMVGLGEMMNEMNDVFIALAEAQCDVLTIGQYLAPSVKHTPVQEYIHPDQFEQYERMAKEGGLRCVYAGPYVRSSYNAAEVMEAVKETICE
ncbi:MAG: lipoyl synthase [Deltaproteobacteria bacterium]|nr:lipoyl synthase [Deltaproteobacteria bacterium]